MKQRLHNLKRTLGTAAAVGVLSIQQAYAVVPAGATDALTEAGGDVNTIGWAVFGVLVAAAAFKYMRRAL